MFTEFENGLGSGIDVESVAKVAFPVHSFNFLIPGISNIVGSISKVFGLGKKKSAFEKCLENWTVNSVYSLGPVDVIPIDIDKLLKQANVQYRYAYSTIHSIAREWLDQNKRLNKARNNFVKIYFSNPDHYDLSQAYCAVSRGGVPIPPGMTEQITNVIKQIQEMAKQQEYNETFDLIENKLEEIVKTMRDIQERGTIEKQALKSSKTVVIPTKPTFKYSPSGVPLMVLGGLPRCCLF